MVTLLLSAQLLWAYPGMDGFWMSVPTTPRPRAVVGLQELGLRVGPAYLFTRPLHWPWLAHMALQTQAGPLALQVGGFLWIGNPVVEALSSRIEAFALDLKGMVVAMGWDFRTGVITYRGVFTSQGSRHFLVLGARLPGRLRLEVGLSPGGLGPVALTWAPRGRKAYLDLGVLFSRAHLLGVPLTVLPLVDVGVMF